MQSSSTRHGYRGEICIKETQTNMEESDNDTEWYNSFDVSPRQALPAVKEKSKAT